jgi:hypothetical protein
MFAEDEEADDMFAKTPTGADGAPTKAEVNAAKGLLDNWDDADGYYQFKVRTAILRSRPNSLPFCGCDTQAHDETGLHFEFLPSLTVCRRAKSSWTSTR